MAYLEIKRGDVLVKRSDVSDALAKKGYSVRLGTKKLTLHLGESKHVGSYTLILKADSVEHHPPLNLLLSETNASDIADGPGQEGPDTQCTLISGYDVLDPVGSPLGKGGMGTVKRAMQLSTEREVAIKFLRGGFTSEQTRFRFEREVKLMARLKHPNIVCIYDSGIHQGNYYYVMELVSGLHLDEYVQQNHYSASQKVALMEKVCRAVQFAHQHGIIHRDLKPSNILVKEDGEPCILDFGLAKSNLEEDNDLNKTIEGEIVGTPAYMSPEQAKGDFIHVDMRTDVFSLGVILFKLLIDSDAHDLTGDKTQVLSRIAAGEIQMSVLTKSKIHSELKAILLKSLEKEAPHRYQSSAELRLDLENWLQGRPILAQSASSIYLIKKIVTQHKTMACILGLLLIIIVSSGSFSTYQYLRSIAAQQEVQTIASQWRTIGLPLFNSQRELTFSYCLNAWQNNNLSNPLAIKAIAAFPKESKEHQAAQFLWTASASQFDPNQLIDNLPQAQRWFAHFILGEYHLKHNQTQLAQSAYEQANQLSKSIFLTDQFKTDSLYYNKLKSRLYELNHQNETPDHAPNKTPSN